MKVRSGEIVGVAGVSGNGQRELGDLILGLQRPHAGTKLLWGEDASRWSIATIAGQGRRRHSGRSARARLRAGIDGARKSRARQRATLSRRARRRLARALTPTCRRALRAWVSRGRILRRARQRLSGGNLQRLVLTRELAHQPKLIVALYPTRGLDARSTIAVRALLRDARDRGAAVLMISEDLDELFEVSDRLLVLFHGAIAAEFDAGGFSRRNGRPAHGRRWRSDPMRRDGATLCELRGARQSLRAGRRSSRLASSRRCLSPPARTRSRPMPIRSSTCSAMPTAFPSCSCA